MIETHESGLHYFEFSHFRDYPAVGHALFTRKGGVSRGVFEGLDMGQGVSDPDGAVCHNRRMLLECMKFDRVLSLNQVHGDTVLVWDRDHAPETPAVADAVVTDRKGVLLLIRTADC